MVVLPANATPEQTKTLRAALHAIGTGQPTPECPVTIDFGQSSLRILSATLSDPIVTYPTWAAPSLKRDATVAARRSRLDLIKDALAGSSVLNAVADFTVMCSGQETAGVCARRTFDRIEADGLLDRPGPKLLGDDTLVPIQRRAEFHEAFTLEFDRRIQRRFMDHPKVVFWRSLDTLCQSAFF